MSTKKKINFIVDESNSSDDAIIDSLKSEFGENFTDDVNVIIGDGLRITNVVNSDNLDVIEVSPFVKYATLNGVRVNIKTETENNDNGSIFKLVRIFDNEDNDIDIDMDKTIFIIHLPPYFIDNMLLNVYIFDRKVFLNGTAAKTTYINKNTSLVLSFPTKETLFNYKLNTYKFFGSIGIEEFNDRHKSGYCYFVLDSVKYKFLLEDGEEKFYKYEDGEYIAIEHGDIQKSDKITIGFNDSYKSLTIKYEDDNLVYGFVNDDGIAEFITEYKQEIPLAQLSSNGIEYNSNNFKDTTYITLKNIAGYLQEEDLKNIYDAIDTKMKDVDNTIKNLTNSALTKDELLNDDNFINSILSKFMDAIKIQLVAKNGDIISNNLIYDENKQAFVLDYDTSLLDGTDYTIELKLS